MLSEAMAGRGLRTTLTDAGNLRLRLDPFPDDRARAGGAATGMDAHPLSINMVVGCRGTPTCLKQGVLPMRQTRMNNAMSETADCRKLL